MERCIKVLSFETSTEHGEEFADEWQVISPSLHGLLACIMNVAHARCHDHVFLSEHLHAERLKAIAISDMPTVRAIDRRQRTARAFATRPVRVYAHDANEDLGENDVPRRMLMFVFPFGMESLARALNREAAHVLAHAELRADAVLKKLAMLPEAAATLQSTIDTLRARRIDADKVTSARVEATARAMADADAEWQKMMRSEPTPNHETEAETPPLYERAPELDPFSAEAAIERAMDADFENASPEDVEAAAQVFDAIVKEEKTKKRKSK